MLHRRHLLGSLAGLAGAPLAALSLPALAAPERGAHAANRFVLVVLRGGLDGLAAVPAPGDPQFEPARGVLARDASSALPLAGPFTLHPALEQLHAMYAQGEALVVHAAGLPYRERSHFDAQQVLESGGARPFELDTGWLARALASDARRGIALNTAVPLVLRGPGEIDTWAPSAGPEPTGDLIARLERLYHDDRVLGPALARARGLRQEADMPVGPMGRPMAGPMAAPNAPAGGEMTAAGTMAPAGGPAGPAGAAGRPAVALARRAAEFLVRPGGPQAAVLELGGWDTHANQAAPNGALANGLRTLDASLGAIRDVLRAPEAHGAWGRTVVVVVTEFGRQVAANGTMGTDHGSGGAAFVLGGAVAGSRVLADWPGLAARDRYEGRDLRTTTDLRAVFRSVLGDHLGVSTAALDRQVFPGTTSALRLDLLRG
jgi:uncharacterized protein (DUF1501 family)